MSFPVSAAPYLPHTPPMLAVDRILYVDPPGEHGEVEAVLRPESILLAPDGTLAPAAMIEILAQSHAAVKGFTNVRDAVSGVRRGYLVGIKSFRMLAAVRAGDVLRIATHLVGGFEDFFIVEAEARVGDALVATGSLKVFLTAEPA